MKALSVAVLLLVIGAGCARWQRDPLKDFPPLMLWAWERPEDLRFIDPAKVGVAYLAGTVDLRAGAPQWRPRMQPLKIPPGTKLMAVVRIESGGAAHGQASEAAEFVSRASTNAGVSALQIDFDARLAERSFYRDLVRDVRRAMPPAMPLTMTALVSWCASDTWIADLPVDAAIPMFFRMGSEKLMRQAEPRLGMCRGNTGISTDELVPVKLSRRVFLFHPRSWTESDLRTTIYEVSHWR